MSSKIENDVIHTYIVYNDFYSNISYYSRYFNLQYCFNYFNVKLVWCGATPTLTLVPQAGCHVLSQLFCRNSPI